MICNGALALVCLSIYLTTLCRFYQGANATENSNLVMKADAVINATVLFKKERLRKISCNDRDGDNVIKLYNKAEVKKYESCVEHFEFFLLIAVTPCPFSPNGNDGKACRLKCHRSWS